MVLTIGGFSLQWVYLSDRKRAFMACKKTIHFVIIALLVQSLLFGATGAYAQQPSIQTNDPDSAKQAYLEQINVRRAWTLATGSVQTVVAVIDSGVDIEHPDLKQNIWVNPGELPGDRIDNDKNGFVDDINGWDFVNDIPDVRPKFGGNYFAPAIHHGTIIAGMIAAASNNAIGIAGISWRTKIMPLRVLDNKGDGEVLNVIRAIDYAVVKKVDAINMSFVGDFDSQLLKEAVKRASDAGIMVVAAAGNDRKVASNGESYPVYPACYNKDIDGVIGVSSLDPLGQKAPFSDYGDCTDISAPGMDLYSTQAVNYEYLGFDAFYGSGWSGTSLSTALVSGAIALLKSINPAMTTLEIKRALREGCDSVDPLNERYAGMLGCGRLNVFGALRSAISQTQTARKENPFEESDFGRYPLAVFDASGHEPFMAFNAQGVKKKIRNDFYPFAPFRVPYNVQYVRGTRLLVFSASKGGPHVRIFDRNFQLVSQFFAYEKTFRGGVQVAVADMDGDGVEDIITSPGQGRKPELRIFDMHGRLKSEFRAYDANYRGGLEVHVGDFNGDKRNDILVTPLAGRGGDIRIYSDTGELFNQFYAYPGEMEKAITIAVGDLDADGTPEIATVLTGNGDVMKVFTSYGWFIGSFSLYGRTMKGMNIRIGKIGDGAKPEIIVTPREKSGAHVLVLNADGKKIGQFFALPKNWRGGLNLGIIE